LVARAKELGIEAQHLLERYALHRFLYRLSKSEYAERFLLKGAQLMLIWIGETVRVTKDADLLGFGDLSDQTLKQVFEDLCTMNVDADGMTYLRDSIQIVPIREDNVYGGRRIFIRARLGNAQLRVQVDVGIGDAVTPEPVWVELPQMLDLPTARLRAYRPETSIAEKLETIVTLGLLNSRMKDYFDIYTLLEHKAFESSVLFQAVRDTFGRRRTPIPAELPQGLTRAFAEEPGKATQWRSFLKRVGGSAAPVDLGVVVDALSVFLWPILRSVHDGALNDGHWPPGGPWQSKEDE
jgi:predicted nucleotidyltransferase component of viral defense system